MDLGMDLGTRYMGLDLKNPLVASASPATGDLGNIRRLEDAGAAAIVLPSLFAEHIPVDPPGAAASPAASELGPDHYLDLVRRAAGAVDIPIIASLNGTSAGGWTGIADQLAEAGAKGIEINVYAIPTDLAATGRAIEQRHIEILRAVRTAGLPVAMKLNPYFSAMGHMAKELDHAGAAALVLFNRFYLPQIDLAEQRYANDLQLSGRNEIRLPLLWIAVLSGRIGASLAASTGVESADQVLQYLFAGADVVMTTSALLRHGVRYVESLLIGLESWLSARGLRSLGEIRGALSQRRLRDPEAFGRASYIEVLHSYVRSPG